MSLSKVLGLPPPRVAAAKSAPAGGGPRAEKLFQAADGWRKTHREAAVRITALKAAVRSHYSSGNAELRNGIEQGLVKLDVVLDPVDDRLADALADAGKASGDAARSAELAKAKTMLTAYIAHMKSEPLLAHIDRNPFKVKTDLKVLLMDGLTLAAKAIG
jgi:hypothetical protein